MGSVMISNVSVLERYHRDLHENHGESQVRFL